jgi:hypothetical protein
VTDPTLVFAGDRDGRPELVVNFGLFAGRHATEAEIYRLGETLLEELESVEIVAEQRFEFDADVEATVHQVRVLLPLVAGGREPELGRLVEAWARDAIGERSVTP